MSAPRRRSNSLRGTPKSSADAAGSMESSVDTTGEATSAAQASTAELDRGWRGWSPALATLLAGVCLWGASPGNWIWIGAIAGILPFAWMIGVDRLPGRRPYTQIYLVSLLHAAVAYYYISLAHIGAAIGWVALAIYLATLWPLMIAVARWWVHRWQLPVWMALPVVWIGTELIRGHLFTGFGMGLLAHSLVPIPTAFQVADLVGSYGVSGLIVLWGTTIAAIVGLSGTVRPSSRWSALAALIVSLIGVLGYGSWRMNAAPGTRTAMIGVVQGNVDAAFPPTVEEAQTYWDAIRTQYRDGTQELLKSVRAEGVRELDLIVWPESKFTSVDAVLQVAESSQTLEMQREAERRAFDIEITGLVSQGVLAESDLEQFNPNAGDRLLSVHDRFRRWIEEREFEFVPMLVGIQSATIAEDFETEGFTQFGNSAALIGSDRLVEARYHKNHLVLFGEYVPFGDWMPWLYDLMPFEAGMVPGKGPTVVRVGELNVAPNICFESTVPHLMRRHLLGAIQADTPIDAFINVTDDSWFHGAHGLDQHYACNVFRAVEMRTPMVVAANGGISAIIDGRGRPQVVSERSQEARFAGLVTAETLKSPYLLYLGDWPAFICATLVVASLIAGPIVQRRERLKNQNRAA